jgi:hypothetical protein
LIRFVVVAGVEREWVKMSNCERPASDTSSKFSSDSNKVIIGRRVLDFKIPLLWRRAILCPEFLICPQIGVF